MIAFQLNTRHQRQGQLETACPKYLRSLGGHHTVSTPGHNFEDFIWPGPNAGQLVKMTVLVLLQISDPDAITHFPQCVGVRLAKLLFLLFMECRQLLLILLTLKGVFTPVFVHNGRHVSEPNGVPPEQETVGE